MIENWLLDPKVTFLNHGSFGACPKVVLDHQAELRTRLEQEPVHFMMRELPQLLNDTREAVSGFLGVNPADLVFVNNATTGVNAVLRSLEFKPGDEILLTDHTYPACKNAAAYVAERTGAKVVTIDVPFPLSGDDVIVERVLSAVTKNTRLALLDHVTSPTGIILPIARLCAELAHRDVPVLCDGAHAPGMLELDVDQIGARYYVGNCHKWLCAPKGAAFLWVDPAHQEHLFAPTISIGFSERAPGQSALQAAFDWTGTNDPTALLCVPRAIEFMESLFDGGWKTLRAHNRGLAVAGRNVLCEALGQLPPCPESMLGSMAAVLLPGDADALHRRLFFEHAIEVPVRPWHGQALLRISLQAYNRLEDVHQLARALRTSNG